MLLEAEKLSTYLTGERKLSSMAINYFSLVWIINSMRMDPKKVGMVFKLNSQISEHRKWPTITRPHVHQKIWY